MEYEVGKWLQGWKEGGVAVGTRVGSFCGVSEEISHNATPYEVEKRLRCWEEVVVAQRGKQLVRGWAVVTRRR